MAMHRLTMLMRRLTMLMRRLAMLMRRVAMLMRRLAMPMRQLALKTLRFYATLAHSDRYLKAGACVHSFSVTDKIKK